MSTRFRPSSGTVSGLDFGNFQTITVTGNVYNDVNGDGIRQRTEAGPQRLDRQPARIPRATSSPRRQPSSSGNYSFTGVGPGSYEVAQVVQTNWVQTQPLYPTVYSFTTQSGHNLSALTFGDHASPALSPVAVIDNGQPGYAETGTWSTVVGGFNGTNRVAHTTTGSATATASWTFTGLPAGDTFDVYVTFAGKSQYSTAAPFTVYDGGTSLGTQKINESILVTQAQGGRAEGSYGGVGWVELGAGYAISSGTLEVLLANNATGSYVDADGVLAGRPRTGRSPQCGRGRSGRRQQRGHRRARLRVEQLERQHRQQHSADCRVERRHPTRGAGSQLQPERHSFSHGDGGRRRRRTGSERHQDQLQQPDHQRGQEPALGQRPVVMTVPR